MRQGGEFFANSIELREVELRVHDPRPCWALRQSAPPRVDDSRMAMGFSPRECLPYLCWGDQKGLVFDGARSGQHIPMRFAGEGGKGRRGKDHFRTLSGELAVQLRKPEVITDGNPHLAPR